MKDAPDCEGGSHKKTKDSKQKLTYYQIETSFIVEIFIFVRSKPLLQHCRQSLPIVKESIIQERKIMFFASAIQGF